jgi:hypothetical protein
LGRARAARAPAASQRGARRQEGGVGHPQCRHEVQSASRLSSLLSTVFQPPDRCVGQLTHLTRER